MNPSESTRHRSRLPFVILTIVLAVLAVPVVLALSSLLSLNVR